jgi:LacI family transcriptional regulator
MYGSKRCKPLHVEKLWRLRGIFHPLTRQRGNHSGQPQRAASMEDVARVAGVSTATVSRVLNTPDLVAPETLDRVHQAIARLGYRPNVFAQGLTTKRSHLLGVILPDIHGEFYSELLRGADAEARRLGYHLLVGSEGHDRNMPLFSSNIVGFIAGLAVMITEPNDALWSQAHGSGLPLVVIDETLHGDRVDRVLVDNRAGTLEAMEHLLANVPPDRCYFLGGPRENFDTAERAKVFVEALASKGRRASSEQVRYGEYSVEWGQRAGEMLFSKRTQGVVGVLAGNDEIAFGLLQTAKDLAVGVPTDLRIVGFDDTRLASLVRPQLSSVRVPMAEVGAAAVRMLAERVQEPQRDPATTILPTRLVVRGTSGGV